MKLLPHPRETLHFKSYASLDSPIFIDLNMPKPKRKKDQQQPVSFTDLPKFFLPDEENLKLVKSMTYTSIRASNEWLATSISDNASVT